MNGTGLDDFSPPFARFFPWVLVPCGVFLMEPDPPTMKSSTTIILLTALLGISLPCPANPAPESPTPPPPAPVDSSGPNEPGPAAPKPPSGTKLKMVAFQDTPLQEAVDYVVEREAAENRTLNVVLAPGLDGLVVPKLTARNITTTEVLAICSRLFDLTLEAVPADAGNQPAAWLIKPRSIGVIPAPGGPSTATTALQPNVSVVTLATSAKPPVEARAISLASLLPPPTGSAESEKSRARNLDLLVEKLLLFARDQDPNARINSYPDLDLIVVKSSALPLIEDGIEAMKRDAEKSAARP